VHESAARFRRAAQTRYGFDPDVREFSEGTETAAAAAAAVGCQPAQIVKSLVFAVTGRADPPETTPDVIVVLTAGDHRVDTDALPAHLDADGVAPADPATVKSATGWSIGGVPPFCHDRDLPVYLDERLRDRELWAAAGTPTAVFSITAARLVALVDPEPLSTFEPVDG
jgi:prolyl-tRNA editing enzyme YbaK/EbsC (Cys-tRNA(Pro) deacylase)